MIFTNIFGLGTNEVFLIFVGLELGAGVAIWTVREEMIEGVDKILPFSERIERSIWSRTSLKNGEMFRLWRLHRSLFPQSSLRSLMIGLYVFAILWALFGLQLLQLN